jgi:type VI secretion system secreted protein VgrG
MGAIRVEAQGDELQLLGQKKVTAQSNEDWVEITGKKGIIINGGGSYIKLWAGGIEIGTEGGWVAHANNHTLASSKSMAVPYEMPRFSDSRPHEEFFILTDARTGKALADYAYMLQYDDHTLQGRTDAQGQTQIVKTSGSKPLSAEARPNTDQFWLLDTQYWEQAPDEFQIDFLRNPKAGDE